MNESQPATGLDNQADFPKQYQLSRKRLAVKGGEGTDYHYDDAVYVVKLSTSRAGGAGSSVFSSEVTGSDLHGHSNAGHGTLAQEREYIAVDLSVATAGQPVVRPLHECRF
jgi:hypothetical protein